MPRHPVPADVTGLYGLLMKPENRPAYIVAAKVGIHPTRLSEYTRRKREIPERILIKLCDVLDATPEEILGDWEVVSA